MAYFSIEKDGKEKFVALLDRPRTILGRSREEAHVILEDPEVSRQHARVVNARGRYRLEVTSEQGLRVGDRKLAPGQTVDLSEGASVWIGPFRCLFSDPGRTGEEAATVTPAHAKAEEGTHLFTNGGEEDAVTVERSFLEALDGAQKGKRWALEKRQVFVGTREDRDIVVVDSYASKKHFMLEWKGRHWRLLDTDSSNGTFVNGIKVDDGAVPFGAEIMLGKTRLRLMAQKETLAVGELPPGLYDGKLYQGMVGTGETMRKVFRLIERGSTYAGPVIILGETGTGKELAAHAIHNRSARSGKFFEALNAATLTANLTESELFGHEKGAFTGAVSAETGAFERADRGTLFLDEIGELPLALQAKLLRVLDQGEMKRVGGTKTIKVDVRLITATHRDLPGMVKAGTFREDLYMRLWGFKLVLPPLSERREDIPELARHLLRIYRPKGPQVILPEAMALLGGHPWSGNVRELRNTIQRAVCLSDGAPIGPEHLEFSPGIHPPKAELSPEAERERIVRALEATGWNFTKASNLLGIKRPTLYDRARELGIEVPRKRKA